MRRKTIWGRTFQGFNGGHCCPDSRDLTIVMHKFSMFPSAACILSSCLTNDRLADKQSSRFIPMNLEEFDKSRRIVNRYECEGVAATLVLAVVVVDGVLMLGVEA